MCVMALPFSGDWQVAGDSAVAEGQAGDAAGLGSVGEGGVQHPEAGPEYSMNTSPVSPPKAKVLARSG